MPVDIYTGANGEFGAGMGRFVGTPTKRIIHDRWIGPGTALDLEGKPDVTIVHTDPCRTLKAPRHGRRDD
ncbi:hypothetical protein [Sphingomonas sp. UNC305MFCol5.2]|uniref:hypothetical protein n=1 Tax=Sphingomonas sp. UNC305MFCol5.2 TaxID=1449076 RepID=UPI000406688A|nr:hypothetical protein [Sphingomonas sp. UNC305MFCol5.2]